MQNVPLKGVNIKLSGGRQHQNIEAILSMEKELLDDNRQTPLPN